MSEDAATATASGDGAAADPRVPWEVEKDSFGDSPELFVGAAFLGGLMLARLLRRLGGEH